MLVGNKKLNLGGICFLDMGFQFLRGSSDWFLISDVLAYGLWPTSYISIIAADFFLYVYTIIYIYYTLRVQEET